MNDDLKELRLLTTLLVGVEPPYKELDDLTMEEIMRRLRQIAEVLETNKEDTMKDNG